MTAATPQTAMDGYKNIWIVKYTAGNCRRPVLLKKMGDVLDLCKWAGKADCIIQKYIEMRQVGHARVDRDRDARRPAESVVAPDVRRATVTA